MEAGGGLRPWRKRSDKVVERDQVRGVSGDRGRGRCRRLVDHDQANGDPRPSPAKHLLQAHIEEQRSIVLRHGDGPDQCDTLGARDVWVYEDKGTYYMHYDAAGPTGWLCALATSKDLLTWEKEGPVLDFGKPGQDDSKGACYGVTYRDGDTKRWGLAGCLRLFVAFHLTVIGYVLFRGRGFDNAALYYQRMFTSFDGYGEPLALFWGGAMILLVILQVLETRYRWKETVWDRLPGVAQGVVIGLMLVVTALLHVDQVAFIYFQF